MTVQRRDLTAIAALEPTLERAKAANEYVEDRMHAVRLAQQIRDHAIGQAIAEHGVTATARAVGMSVSHVKKCRDAKAPSSPDDDGDDPPPTRAPKKSSEIEKLGDTSLPASLPTSESSGPQAPAGLAERGAQLWIDLHHGQTFGPADEVLVEEACRLAERLEKLDELLRGDANAWARLIRDGDDDRASVLIINSAASEARQSANLLRQIVVSLGLATTKSEAKPGGDALDDLAAARRARLSAAQGS